jgi:hypothetical protein
MNQKQCTISDRLHSVEVWQRHQDDVLQDHYSRWTDLEDKHKALAAAFQDHLFWGSVMGGFMATSILVSFAYLFVRVGVL